MLPQPWHRDAASFGRMVVLTNMGPSNLSLLSGPHHKVFDWYKVVQFLRLAAKEHQRGRAARRRGTTRRRCLVETRLMIELDFYKGEIGRMYSPEKCDTPPCSPSFVPFFFVTPFFDHWGKWSCDYFLWGEFSMHSPVLGDITISHRSLNCFVYI